MGDTDRTPDGGFSAGYMGGGNPNVRKVAAYVYQALLSLASTQLGVPVGSPDGEGRRRLRRRQEPDLRPARRQPGAQPDDPDRPAACKGLFGLTVGGNPPTKAIADYKIVGQSIPMRTIPPIVAGTATFVGDVRLPGMVHARVVHPSGLGATLASVGTLDKKRFPNTEIVVKGNLVAVVDPAEYVAIQAASGARPHDEVERRGAACPGAATSSARSARPTGRRRRSSTGRQRRLAVDRRSRARRRS